MNIIERNEVIKELFEKGLAVVPLEPTKEMIMAGRYEIGVSADSGSFQQMAVSSYKAMIKEFYEGSGDFQNVTDK